MHYAEYPEIKDRVEQLRSEKTQQSVASLGQIWHLDAAATDDIVRRLVDVGFFEQRGTKQTPVLWVPFLYRDALDMIQGSADDLTAQ